MKAIRKIQEFIADSRAVGIVLMGCTILSLALANSPAAGAWLGWWNLSPGTGHHWTIGPLHLPNSISDWLNDAGMSVFFLMAGMEIKRELTSGELSTFRQALLPAAAAIGGMLLPAALFTLFTRGTTYANGWGIPMATDIAFSLGVASILGSRVPLSLKIFLTALAIIDDLGAIIMIALFYSQGISLYYLLAGLGIWGCLLALNRFKAPFGWVQYLLGLALWYCIFNSGLHATVAGVLFALVVPTSKLQTWEHRLRIPVNFVIIPLFALAGTAIHAPTGGWTLFKTPLAMGILSGLLIGKTLGIAGTVYLFVRLGLAALPTGSNWKQVIGIGLLAGIGFTMSIFITLLAFDRPDVQDTAKIAVLAASLLAIIGGLAWFKWVARNNIV